MDNQLTTMYVLSYRPGNIPEPIEPGPSTSQNLWGRSFPNPAPTYRHNTILPPTSHIPPYIPRDRYSRTGFSPSSTRHRDHRSYTAHRNGTDRSTKMSRPVSSSRPTHIPLPISPFVAHSPNGTPLATPTGGGMASPTSPRSSFLPSFMRPRSRAATVSNINRGGATSPSAEVGNPLGSSIGRGGGGGGSSGEAIAGPVAIQGAGVTRSVSTPVNGGLANSVGNGKCLLSSLENATYCALKGSLPSGPSAPNTSSTTQPRLNGSVPPKTFRIRLVPHLETSRSLAFDPVVRELLPIVVPSGISPSVAAASVTGVGPTLNGRLPALILKVGRFTDKPSHLPVPATPAVNANGGGTLGPSSGAGLGMGIGANSGPGIVAGPAMIIAGGGGEVTSGKVAFKSKVVSRSHAEIWCEAGGKVCLPLMP